MDVFVKMHRIHAVKDFAYESENRNNDNGTSREDFSGSFLQQTYFHWNLSQYANALRLDTNV